MARAAVIEIPARWGNPYTLARTKSGLLRLTRKTPHGHEAFLCFDPVDAVAVADALIDAVEVDNN